MSDLFKTQLQRNGQAATFGLSLAELYTDVVELGIDPRDVRMIGNNLVVWSLRRNASDAGS